MPAPIALTSLLRQMRDLAGTQLRDSERLAQLENENEQFRLQVQELRIQNVFDEIEILGERLADEREAQWDQKSRIRSLERENNELRFYTLEKELETFILHDHQKALEREIADTSQLRLRLHSALQLIQQTQQILQFIRRGRQEIFIQG